MAYARIDAIWHLRCLIGFKADSIYQYGEKKVFVRLLPPLSWIEFNTLLTQALRSTQFCLSYQELQDWSYEQAFFCHGICHFEMWIRCTLFEIG